MYLLVFMKKGQIFCAKKQFKKTDVFHPVIYLQGNPEDENSFITCIISTKPAPKNAVVKNVSMGPIHFETENEHKEKYKITYNNSHLVLCGFVKESCKFDKNEPPCGELTDEGIKWIEEQLQDAPIVTYDHLVSELTEEYIREMSTSFKELLNK